MYETCGKEGDVMLLHMRKGLRKSPTQRCTASSIRSRLTFSPRLMYVDWPSLSPSDPSFLSFPLRGTPPSLPPSLVLHKRSIPLRVHVAASQPAKDHHLKAKRTLESLECCLARGFFRLCTDWQMAKRQWRLNPCNMKPRIVAEIPNLLPGNATLKINLKEQTCHMEEDNI